MIRLRNKPVPKRRTKIYKHPLFLVSFIHVYMHHGCLKESCTFLCYHTLCCDIIVIQALIIKLCVCVIV